MPLKPYLLVPYPVDTAKAGIIAGFPHFPTGVTIVAERKRNRRNTLERRCLGKDLKRLFAGSPKATWKMLEKVKRIKASSMRSSGGPK